MPLPPEAGQFASLKPGAPGASSPSDNGITPASAMSAGRPAASPAAANLGQQLLAQLQGQPGVGNNPDAGVDLGRGLLQQLQHSMVATPMSHQQTTQPSVTQTDAGRTLLAQLQRSPAKHAAGFVTGPGGAQPAAPALPLAQPNQGFGGGNAAAVSFEQLLRGAAASQQPRAQPTAQPQPPVADPSTTLSFGQLLRAAVSGGNAQSVTPAMPPGFGTRQLPSEAAQRATAEAVTNSDSARLLLQQLQQGGLQASALGLQQPQQRDPGFPSLTPQQASAQFHTRYDDAQAGKLLLQQLQGVSVSEASAAAARSSVGAVAGSPQPVPSAPPAPTSVLLQSAVDMSASHGASQLGTAGCHLSHVHCSVLSAVMCYLMPRCCPCVHRYSVHLQYANFLCRSHLTCLKGLVSSLGQKNSINANQSC